MMKKNIYYNLIGLALLIVSIAACDTADQDVSPVTSPAGYTKATFVTDFSGTSVTEGDTIVYSVSIDKTIDRSITFSARVLEGTGNEDDITVIPGVIAPYTNEITVSVIFNQDWDAESAETMKLEVGAFGIADKYLLNATTINPILNLNVNNYVSDILSISVDWAQEFLVEEIIEVKVDVGTYFTYLTDTVEATYDLADEVDYDIYLTPATDFDITDPWANDPVDAAETGDVPEVFEVSGLDDGEYVLWSFLYRNYVPEEGFYSLVDSTQRILITAGFTRQGTDLDLAVVQDSSQAPIIYQRGYSPAAYRSYVFGIIAKVIVADGKYTIEDYEGTQSGPWKGSALVAPKPPKSGFVPKNR